MRTQKPEFFGINVIDGYNPDIVGLQEADFSPTPITRNEWIASLDANNNQAWQTLHIEVVYTPNKYVELFKGFTLAFFILMTTFTLLGAF